MDDLDAARRWYAEDIGAVAPVRSDPRVVEAFATVPREAFLGPGPWQLHSRLNLGATHVTADADPRHLYHDVLVTIEAVSGINNGLPSLWAMVFDALSIRPGTRVLQIGAGTGYFTAILAELVTDSGRVTAHEIEPGLAARAASALAPWPQARVQAGDASAMSALPECDVAVVCAGATHVPPAWLSALAPKGRMMIPMTGANGWGCLMHLVQEGGTMPVRSLGPCGFYPCTGARTDANAQALSAACGAGTAQMEAYHMGAPQEGAAVWMQGEGFWISKRPEPAQ